MVLSQSEIDQIFEEIHKKLINLYKENDQAGIFSYYHPDAVVIYPGKFIKYGEEEIKAEIKLWAEDSMGGYKIIPSKRVATTDGEFLIEQGVFEVTRPNGDIMHSDFETIYKKIDGKYVIYRDWFKIRE
uniref:SnoaL-like domain-containing protein n=1 Tax=Acrobeloides nanus TaxID=290746 RepID=A0A914CBP1_9BILA